MNAVWHNMTLSPNAHPDDYIRDAALVVENGKIVWLGPKSACPTAYAAWEHINLNGNWVTPGFIDCHTHLVYGGNRADEFAMRLAGISYEEIAKRGGGIVSTVNATRALSEEALFAASAPRLQALIQEGVTTVEIKSGYGLDLATERKMLRVAKQLGEYFGINVYTTFLGAHALPPEYAGRADDYIDLVCNEMLPTLHSEGLIDAVDIFCEKIGFTLAHSEQLFKVATALHLPVKMHAEQLSNMGGAALTAKYKGFSADHLEYLDEEAIIQMKAAGTVAVLLPGAYYFIRETKLPPLDDLRKHQVPIALSTDSNPGTSPVTSLPLILNMACTLFRMTVPEVLAGVTSNAALALGQSERHGTLAIGRDADFAVWQVDTLAELAYWFGRPLCQRVVKAGKTLHQQNNQENHA